MADKLREFIEKLRRRWGRGPAVIAALVRHVSYVALLGLIVVGSLLAAAHPQVIAVDTCTTTLCDRPPR